jgi:sugar phosphate isomerase/epimerase
MTVKPALYSRLLDDRSLAAAVELTAELGYDGVELMGREPHLSADTSTDEAAALRERLDDLGLAVPCIYTHTGGDGQSEAERAAELDALDPFLELAAVLDCPVVKHGVGGPPEHRATAEDYETAAEWLARAADRAAESGRAIGVEIHAGTLAESASGAMELIERADRENVVAIHDAGNMYIADADFGHQSVATLGDRLAHLHVKDLRRVEDASLPGAFRTETPDGEATFQHRHLGEGDVDHGELFGALDDAGFDGYATDECAVPQPDPDDDLAVARREREALAALLGESGGDAAT